MEENKENDVLDFDTDITNTTNDENILNEDVSKASSSNIDNSSISNNDVKDGVFSAMNEFMNSIMPQAKTINNINEEVVKEVMPNELGRVKDVSGDSVIIYITSDTFNNVNLIDHYVYFDYDNYKRLVGMVSSINKEVASVKLIGEINNNRFVPGVLSKPSMDSICFVASPEETKLIVVDDTNINNVNKFLLGTMPLYNNEPAYVSTNTFFSNHFAIFGNTGSGKSCGVSRLFQNVFFNQVRPPKGACIFIFDAYGEYESALSIPNSQVLFKRYSTNVRTSMQNLIKLPLWLLDIDDYALLLDVDDPA